MTTLKFVDTHNMVAFLSKPIECEGFEQLVDFLKQTLSIFLEQQVGEMSSHKRINETPSHTKKIFGNMRRVGKGFSGRETPLFQTMFVQDQADMGEDNVADEAVNEEMNDTLVRGATTASSLEADQDNGNIKKIQSKATPNEPSSLGTSSGGGPRRQDTMGDTSARTSLKLEELMALCTTLQQRVLDLENTKTVQAWEITSLKLRVKKLEKKDRKRTHKLKRLNKVGLSDRVISSEDKGLDKEDASKQGRKIHDIDADEDITLENVHDTEMFDVNNLQGDEVCVEKEVHVKEVSVVGKVNAASIATTVSAAIITEVAITLAQAQAELKSTRPKAKGLVIHEQEQAPTPTPTRNHSRSVIANHPNGDVNLNRSIHNIRA
ncbi:hypothetical protein Tco_1445799, partial [Tanacetum coccineum]